MNPRQQKKNYSRELERILEGVRREGRKPVLLLHSCCAPCSSYVLEYLAPFFHILDFYYNPNILPESEYHMRKEELSRLIRDMKLEGEVEFLEGQYDPETFLLRSSGLEEEPEGGKRCLLCYELRLREAAREARRQGADFFATTLTISPLKKAEAINAIGYRIAEEEGIFWLPSDFKKKNGYKRSVELSRIYDLYRQNFCGCPFSRLNKT